MKAIIYNGRQLDTIIADICDKYREYGELSIDYNKPYHEKSRRQLGFVFGGLIDSVVEFYKNIGEKWEVEDVKENFYSACAYLDDNLKKTVTRFNGEKYEVPKRLSEMDRETASIFIDRCIYLIDHAKCFQGLTLHPSLRNTWIRHITEQDVDEMRYFKYPREDRDYLAYQRKQNCLWCGRSGNTEVHHLKELGYTGTSYKADDWLSIPLCSDCHRAYHTQGKKYFEKSFNWLTKYVDLVTFCRLKYIRWRNHR